MGCAPGAYQPRAGAMFCGYMYCAEHQCGSVPKVAATRNTARMRFTTTPAEKGENQVGAQGEDVQTTGVPLSRRCSELERYFRISWIL